MVLCTALRMLNLEYPSENKLVTKDLEPDCWQAACLCFVPMHTSAPMYFEHPVI